MRLPSPFQIFPNFYLFPIIKIFQVFFEHILSSVVQGIHAWTAFSVTAARVFTPVILAPEGAAWITPSSVSLISLVLRLKNRHKIRKITIKTKKGIQFGDSGGQFILRTGQNLILGQKFCLWPLFQAKTFGLIISSTFFIFQDIVLRHFSGHNFETFFRPKVSGRLYHMLYLELRLLDNCVLA